MASMDGTRDPGCEFRTTRLHGNVSSPGRRARGTGQRAGRGLGEQSDLQLALRERPRCPAFHSSTALGLAAWVDSLTYPNAGLLPRRYAGRLRGLAPASYESTGYTDAARRPEAFSSAQRATKLPCIACRENGNQDVRFGAAASSPID
jgi:hypothetical protein